MVVSKVVEVGVSLVCVDNSNQVATLTVGKIYDVVGIMSTFPYSTLVKVVGDDGDFHLYGHNRFVLLDNWREQQINKIL